MRGTFIAVVGPSGSGKDTLIRAALDARPDLAAARRVISRPPDDASEVFDSVTEAAFAGARADGLFALDWQAHGLSYGIPIGVDRFLTGGRHVLANLSRQAIGAARERFSPFLTVVVTGLVIGLLADPAPAQSKKLSVAYMPHPIQEQQLKWMKKWGEANGVEIRPTPISYEVYVEKLTASLPPDAATSTTWLLVRISPSAVSTMPEPVPLPDAELA